MNRSAHTRTTDVLRGLGALLVFAVLLVAVPLGLYAVAGWPIPRTLPSGEQITVALTRPDTDHHLLLGAIRFIGWAAWVMFTASTCVEALSRLAGKTTPSLPLPALPLQILTRNLVATATLAFGVTAPLTAPASAAVHTTADAHLHSPGQPSSGHDTSPTESTEWEPLLGDKPPKPKRQGWQTLIVRRGDTLWSLARRAYGSGHLYPKIFKASRKLAQPNGLPGITHPDEIHPGQRVRLPRPQKTPASPSPARESPPGAGHHSAPAEQETGDQQKAQRQGRATPSQIPAPVVAPPRTPPPTTPSSSPQQTVDEVHPTASFTLPSGSYIGLGLASALSVAVAATRLHRRRQRLPGEPSGHGSEATGPTPAAAVLRARKKHLDSSYVNAGSSPPSDAELIAQGNAAGAPDHVSLGTRDGALIALPVAGLSLGLSGDGVRSAARAIATEFLARASRDRAELLISQSDAEGLFSIDTLTDVPGLTVTPDLGTAITHLEAEVIRRARLLNAADQPDLPALRAADPAEPLPTVLLAASVPEQANATVQAITQLGNRHGIGALLLDATSARTSLRLEDFVVTYAEGAHAESLTGANLFHLTAEDAAGMLLTLRSATGAAAPSNDAHQPGTPVDAGLAPEGTPNIPTLATPPRLIPGNEPAPIRLQLLGPVRLHTNDGPIHSGLRRSARDLLAYLALHPTGITRDQGCGALWPDHDPETAIRSFNTAISNIRKVLRKATNLREPMYIIHSIGRYSIDTTLIDVDLWHLNTALTSARKAATDAERIGALRPIPDLYTAEFASDLNHAWADNHREYLHRTVIDALARLARLLQDDHPDQALAILENAITHAPHAEPLYRSVMQLQSRLGHPDAVQRTFSLLTGRLADLDTEPDDQTHELRTTLLSSAPE